MADCIVKRKNSGFPGGQAIFKLSLIRMAKSPLGYPGSLLFVKLSFSSILRIGRLVCS